MHPSEFTLNEYIDETLAAAERADVERHLEGCESCRRAVAELRDVTRAVRELPPMTPPPFVARAFQASEGGVPERVAPQQDKVAPPVARPSQARGALPERWAWLAAAAAILIAAGVTWQLMSPRLQPGGAPATTPPAATAQSVESELRQAEAHYQKAITGLEQIANSEQGQLDPQTAATLQKNLAVIDQAIGESRAALKQEPTSEPAQESLLENFKTKLALLEDTVALINEMRKGNEAGAARIASGLKKKG